MGEKTIAYKLKDMSASADKLRARVDSEEELEAGLVAEIEEALDTADLLAKSAVIQLDKLTADKEETKALISARPKMAFEVFTGASHRRTFHTGVLGWNKMSGIGSRLQ